MNYRKLERKISDLINTLIERRVELIERRNKVVAKLKLANRTFDALWDEYSRIEKVIGEGEWFDMLDDLDDDISDLGEQIEELNDEFNGYDNVIVDIEYAFENATVELENGISASKRS
jgi:predicted nuclease with TOPRIM domain